MRKGHFTEGQIIGMIKELEAGLHMARYAARRLQAGDDLKTEREVRLEVPDVRRLQQLQDVNGKLKRMLAESVLDTRS
jgi:putative transposase